MLRTLLVIAISVMLLMGCGGQAVVQPITGENIGDNLRESEQEETKELADLETSLTVTEKEDDIVFDITLENKVTKDIEVTFPSGQQFEIVVTADDGEEVYRYSMEKLFTQAIQHQEVKAGQQLTWREVWDSKVNGEQIPTGTYQAEVKINILTETTDLKISEESLVSKAEFTIAAEDQEQPLTENDAFRNIHVVGENGKYTVTGEARVYEATMHYAVSDGHIYYVEDIAKDGARVNVLYIPLESIGY